LPIICPSTPVRPTPILPLSSPRGPICPRPSRPAFWRWSKRLNGDERDLPRCRLEHEEQAPKCATRSVPTRRLRTAFGEFRPRYALSDATKAPVRSSPRSWPVSVPRVRGSLSPRRSSRW
jgi:hypothetical protein